MCLKYDNFAGGFDFERVREGFVERGLPPAGDDAFFDRPLQSANGQGGLIHAENRDLLPRVRGENSFSAGRGYRAVVGKHTDVGMIHVVGKQTDISQCMVFALAGSSEYQQSLVMQGQGIVERFGQVVCFLIGVADKPSG